MMKMAFSLTFFSNFSPFSVSVHLLSRFRLFRSLCSHLYNFLGLFLLKCHCYSLFINLFGFSAPYPVFFAFSTAPRGFLIVFPVVINAEDSLIFILSTSLRLLLLVAALFRTEKTSSPSGRARPLKMFLHAQSLLHCRISLFLLRT